MQSAPRRDDPAARAGIDAAKVALGECSPVRWIGGTPDRNRRLAPNTCHADWYAQPATSAALG